MLRAYAAERVIVETAMQFGVEGALSAGHATLLEDLETAIQLKGRAYIKAALARAQSRLETFKTRSDRRRDAQAEIAKLEKMLA